MRLCFYHVTNLWKSGQDIRRWAAMCQSAFFMELQELAKDPRKAKEFHEAIIAVYRNIDGINSSKVP